MHELHGRHGGPAGALGERARHGGRCAQVAHQRGRHRARNALKCFGEAAYKQRNIISFISCDAMQRFDIRPNENQKVFISIGLKKTLKLQI